MEAYMVEVCNCLPQFGQAWSEPGLPRISRAKEVEVFPNGLPIGEGVQEMPGNKENEPAFHFQELSGR